MSKLPLGYLYTVITINLILVKISLQAQTSVSISMQYFSSNTLLKPLTSKFEGNWFFNLSAHPFPWPSLNSKILQSLCWLCSTLDLTINFFFLDIELPLIETWPLITMEMLYNCKPMVWWLRFILPVAVSSRLSDKSTYEVVLGLCYTF
jgi:hypothetical protein